MVQNFGAHPTDQNFILGFGENFGKISVWLLVLMGVGVGGGGARRPPYWESLIRPCIALPSCQNRRTIFHFRQLSVVVSCPCDKCEAWYKEEQRDLSWKDTLNRELPCPCKVSVHPNRVVADQGDPPGNSLQSKSYCKSFCFFVDLKLPRTTPLWRQNITLDYWQNDVIVHHFPGDKPIYLAGREPGPEWIPDRSCTAHSEPYCSTYHPGAYGCLRSTDSPKIGKVFKY